MASREKQTTKESFFQCCLVSSAVICVLSLRGAEGQCSLPKGLRGWWTDSDKGLLTFTRDTVNRYNIYTFGEFTLSCYQQNSSTYIMESASFAWFSMNFTAYACWTFVRQSKNVFHLYELTEPNQQAGNEKVIIYLPITDRVFDDICSKFTAANLTNYRILQKRKVMDQEREMTIMIVVGVLVVVLSLAAVIVAVAIRWRRSRGIFQINDKPSDPKQQDRAKAYKVSDEDTDAVSTPAAQPSFKKTTTPRMILEHGSEHPLNTNSNHAQVENSATEDNTSERVSSHSSVSVTATSGFTSVSAASSSVYATVSASASSSCLPIQDVSGAMTPICGSEDKEDKQTGGSDQFTCVQFTSEKESASQADLIQND